MKTNRFFNLFLALCLVLGALAFAPLQSARAATLTVDTLTDNNDGSCMDGDCTLREAIQVAASGDTITFSVTGTITLTMGQITINKNLTISGPGPDLLAISGGNASRVIFLTSSPTVTLSGVTIQDGYIVGAGGGVFQSNGTLVLDQVKVIGNSVDGAGALGGGVYAGSGSSLTITNSLVSQNEAEKGSGIACSSCASLTVINSIVSDNDDLDAYTSASYGGGMYVSAVPSVTFDRITVSGNTAGIGGGLASLNSAVTITNSTISGNVADFNSGGGVYFSSVTSQILTMSNVTVSGNQQTSGGGFIGGGGILMGQGVLNLNNGTVVNNASAGTYGGGGLLAGNLSTVNMSNSILANNTSSGTTDADCSISGGVLNSLDYNLIEDADGGCVFGGATAHNATGLDPMLDALADNGGDTQTHALLTGSPAIDAGNDATCSILDQRGVSRPFDGDHNGSAICDMGTYEVDNSAPTDMALSGDSVLENLPAGTTVGSLSTTDADPADTHVYSFCGGADDASFTLSASDLQTAVPFDFEAKASYSICVRATDPYGLTYDETFVITVLDVPGLELIAPADTSAMHTRRPFFDWANLPGAIGYQIQVATNPTFTLPKINKTLNGATNSQYTPISDLAANTLFYWRVRAKLTATTYSAWSPVYTFTSGNPPGVPTLASPANNALQTNLSPTLDWSNSTVPAGTTFDHYQVQVDDTADFSSLVIEEYAGVSTLAVGPLSPNTKYYWRVRSWNTAGDYSTWSAVRYFREAMTAPLLISPVSGVTVGNLKPLFDWNDVAGATSYTIQVSLSNTFNTFAINATIKTATSLYTHSLNLQAGKLYFWRVRANGPNGPSAWSAVESFMTP